MHRVMRSSGVHPAEVKIAERQSPRLFFSYDRAIQGSRCAGLRSGRIVDALRLKVGLELLGWAIVLVSICGGAQRAAAFTADVQESISQFKRMSLDELLNEKVVTVSKSPERISSAAAAIQVITSEDIRRSAATTLPEALRLASNLQVARVSSSSWAISARGFNNTLANKLLVMIDGRTVYTPLYAGVFWDVQNVMLEDIDRIEVVSGPGGTLWGANAVNGVINVITKQAKETQGTYLSAGVGSFLQDFGAVRYGGSNGSNLFFRVYAQRLDFNTTKLPVGPDAPDDWNMTQGGLRLDWEPSSMDALTLQGDLYSGKLQGATGDTGLDGQNVVGRWTRVLSSESEFQVQMYFDRTWREAPTYSEALVTYDIDFQHRFEIGNSHRIVWGGDYRLMADRIDNTSTALAFLPEDRNLQLFSGFVQDEITLAPDHLTVALGTKFEHNDFSGYEYQPSLHAAWTPNEDQTVWVAVSRAVRSPSRIDTDAYIPAPPVPGDTPRLEGGPHFDSEKLIALELGYRVRPAKPLWFSITGFYNFYDDLRSLDQTTTNHFVLGNHFKGEVRGVELWAEYAPVAWWRLRTGYTYLNKNLRPHGGTDVSSSVREGNDPENQFTFQSILDLPARFQFDVAGRYVDTLPSPRVPQYFTFDIRLSWQYRDWELSLVGQNLAESGHREFGMREIPRGVYGKIALRF